MVASNVNDAQNEIENNAREKKRAFEMIVLSNVRFFFLYNIKIKVFAELLNKGS